MAYQFTLDDVRFLSSAAGAEALELAAALPLTDASLLGDLTRLRRLLGSSAGTVRAGVVAETVRLRRRALGKLGPAAARWLFTDEALQQATPLPVATHRGGLLQGLVGKEPPRRSGP